MDNQGTDSSFTGPSGSPSAVLVPDPATGTFKAVELTADQAALLTGTVIEPRSRPSRPERRFRGWVALSVIIVALIASIVVAATAPSGPGWPASVATVKTEIAAACKNPDVASEPGQVNFACNQSTSQILWVFALMTSHNNASFVDSKTGRLGLEPIAPSEGGQLAQWLNFHSPYNPFNPVMSLQVAARAINSIIGGTTTTGANGVSAIVPGLESSPANCLRYTGSRALRARPGFPPVCAKAASTVRGQGSLVEDVYGKWVTTATPSQSYDAALLFMNSGNPDTSQVQAVLQKLGATHAVS